MTLEPVGNVADGAPSRWRYLLVGAGNTTVGYGLFALCYSLLDRLMPHVAILIMAHVLAVSFSFATHRRWVFGRKGNESGTALWGAWTRFQLSYIGLLLLGLTVNGAMLRWVDPSPWLAQGVATVVGVGMGWLLHRYVVFKHAGSPTRRAHD